VSRCLARESDAIVHDRGIGLFGRMTLDSFTS